MRIKEVTLKDLNQIHKIEKEVFGEDSFSKKLIKRLIQKNLFFIKLELKDIKKPLIGFAICLKDRQDQVNIINFVIKPKFQNKGYGGYLLEETLNKVKKMDEITQVVLNVKIYNQKAIHLYEKFKFKIINKIDDYYKSGDAGFLMERKLIN